MTTATMQGGPEGHRSSKNNAFVVLLVFIFGSMAAHVVGMAALAIWVETRPIVAVKKPVELQFFEVEKPKPPPPPEPEVAKPEPIKPPPVKLKVKPPPIKVAEQKAPPPPSDLPPPPNDAPPPTPSKPVPVVVGISMSSTTTGGSFAAAVGNTMYGKTADKAVAPQNVKAYSAPKYVPPSQVDEMASLLSDVKIPYPPQAKAEGIEGSVVLRLVIDPEGKVVDAKVLRGPGYGLNEAALGAIRRFKFKSATKGGERVSTELDYTYTFLLD